MVDQRGKVMKDTDRNKKENIFFFFFFSFCILLVFSHLLKVSPSLSFRPVFPSLLLGFPKTSLTDVEKKRMEKRYLITSYTTTHYVNYVGCFE